MISVENVLSDDYINNAMYKSEDYKKFKEEWDKNRLSKDIKEVMNKVNELINDAKQYTINDNSNMYENEVDEILNNKELPLDSRYKELVRYVYTNYMELKSCLNELITNHGLKTKYPREYTRDYWSCAKIPIIRSSFYDVGDGLELYQDYSNLTQHIYNDEFVRKCVETTLPNYEKMFKKIKALIYSKTSDVINKCDNIVKWLKTMYYERTRLYYSLNEESYDKFELLGWCVDIYNPI